MTMFRPTTLALLAEALRAAAADLDQQAAATPPWDATPAPEPVTASEPAADSAPAESTTTSAPSKSAMVASKSTLLAAELSKLREQAFKIIESAISASPATAAERVTAVLKEFDAARVSDLTAATAPAALKALQNAFS
jgi:hypothetical protein